jgi:hypothetical protein
VLTTRSRSDNLSRKGYNFWLGFAASILFTVVVGGIAVVVAKFEQRWFLRLLGLLFVALAIAAAFAPPFSGLDTLPALGAVAVALAIILEVSWFSRSAS